MEPGPGKTGTTEPDAAGTTGGATGECRAAPALVACLVIGVLAGALLLSWFAALVPAMVPGRWSALVTGLILPAAFVSLSLGLMSLSGDTAGRRLWRAEAAGIRWTRAARYTLAAVAVTLWARATVWLFVLLVTGEPGAALPFIDVVRDVSQTLSGPLAGEVWGRLVTAPIWEEFLFRGWLLTFLSRRMPGRWAIPLSALAFGLSHAHRGVWNILTGFVAGLVLGWARNESGGLLLPWWCHSLMNLLWVRGPATLLRPHLRP